MDEYGYNMEKYDSDELNFPWGKNWFAFEQLCNHNN